MDGDRPQKRKKVEFAKREDLASMMAQIESLKHENQSLKHNYQSLEHKYESLEHKYESLEHKYESLEQSITLRRLKEEYFPKIDRTISGPHISTNHEAAQVRQLRKIMDVCHSLSQTSMNESFWATPCVIQGTESSGCNSESEAQELVVYLVQSVIKALGIQNCVYVARNRSLAGSECDILLVYKPNNLPFAVVEVKKPANSQQDRHHVWFGLSNDNGNDENRVAGQIFDAMTSLQLFGFPRMCGMIATWNHWRLVGTYMKEGSSRASKAKDSAQFEHVKHAMANSDSFSKLIRIANGQGMNCSSETGCNMTNGDSPEQRRVVFEGRKTPQTKPSGRTVWASPIVPSFEESMTENEIFDQVKRSGEEIISLITLFIVLSCHELMDFLEKKGDALGRNPPKTIWKTMPCRILRSNEAEFAFGSISLKGFKEEQFPQEGAALYVIHHLGMGGFGNCCLAVTAEGNASCAIKFYHDPATRNQMAQRECENWNNVYQGGDFPDVPLCRTLKAAEGLCLVMPYLRPIPKGARAARLQNGSIQRALRRFSSSGFVHGDVKWRHLGLWNDDVVLLDLGDVSEQESPKEQQAWVDRSLETLQQRASISSS